MEKSLVQQWTRSGFDTILLPRRVCVYAEVAKYVTKDEVVPVSDLDNQYTTIQEMLQNGLIMEDDKQICAFFVEEIKVLTRDNQYARCWLWVDDETPRHSQYDRFHNRSRQEEIVPEIPSLLSLIMNGEEYD